MPVSRRTRAAAGALPVPNGRAGRVDLSDEQRAAVGRLVSGWACVQTLGGYAGVGKTTVVRTLKERLPRYAVCAFTGKAANVLRRKGVGASTIHSLIYTARDVEWWDEDGCFHTKTVFELKSPDEVDCSGFIVDEASMVNRELHDALLTFGRPLIYIGDHGQLPPVGGADFNLMAKPDITLETIHRNAGEIARFAEFLRKGNQVTDWQSHPGCTGDRVRLTTLGEMDEQLKYTSDQVICAYNRTRVGVNEQVRDHYGYPPDQPVVGDRVMCLQNNHFLGVFNGMQGTVKSLDGSEMVFTAGGQDYPVRFSPKSFNLERQPPESRRQVWLPFDYCYIITCHKAQGDEWPNVLVFEERCRRWEHARWAYTAASRAKEKLTWVVL